MMCNVQFQRFPLTLWQHMFDNRSFIDWTGVTFKTRSDMPINAIAKDVKHPNCSEHPDRPRHDCPTDVMRGGEIWW